MRYLIFLSAFIISWSAGAQTWVDSLDNFARNAYLPPNQYLWIWQHAPMLHAMEIQYEMMPEEEKEQYFQYIKRAMDRNFIWATGTSPNALASANGMAFMYRTTRQGLYQQISDRLYYQFLDIPRTSNGGVSHLSWTPELWDDTIYMVGVYLLGMYRATLDEKYITDLIDQIKAHKEKLLIPEWGLWVHGWDGDNMFDFDFCSQPNWADDSTRRSQELWGRGNGWVVVILSELLNTIDEEHEEWDFVASSLVEMIEYLPSLQDQGTGHWFQLPVRYDEEDNFLESSCTAMFGYGILNALKHNLVSGDDYENAVQRAYQGLRNHSVHPQEINGTEYYTTKNVCGGTCIGDKDYYFSREVVYGEAYAIAMFIIFGRAYETMYLDSVATDVLDNMLDVHDFQLYPVPLGSDGVLNIEIKSPYATNIGIEVIDLLGRIIFRKSEKLAIGENRKRIQISNISAGEYFLLIRGQHDKVLLTKQLTVP